MTDSKLVAIHEIELGPQDDRRLVKAGKGIPADIHVDLDLEAELIRAGAVKRVPTASPVSSEISEPEIVGEQPERTSRRTSRYKKHF